LSEKSILLLENARSLTKQASDIAAAVINKADEPAISENERTVSIAETIAKVMLCITGIAIQAVTIYTLWGHWASASQCAIYTVYIFIRLVEHTLNGSSLSSFIPFFSLTMTSNVGSFLLVSIPLLKTKYLFSYPWFIATLTIADFIFTVWITDWYATIIKSIAKYFT
jgi:hypothetical protein